MYLCLYVFLSFRLSVFPISPSSCLSVSATFYIYVSQFFFCVNLSISLLLICSSPTFVKHFIHILLFLFPFLFLFLSPLLSLSLSLSPSVSLCLSLSIYFCLSVSLSLRLSVSLSLSHTHTHTLSHFLVCILFSYGNGLIHVLCCQNGSASSISRTFFKKF